MSKNQWWVRLVRHLIGVTQEHLVLDRWTVACRDEHGRPACLLVSVTETAVVITPSVTGSLSLPGLAVGRIRSVLRIAAIRAELDLDEPIPPAPVAPAPLPRQHVDLHVPPTDPVA